MKAQLSLEFLIIIAIFTTALLIITPNILRLKQTSDLALEANNAKTVLNEIYYSCERAKITGEPQSVELTALGNYKVYSNETHLLLLFENKTTAKRVPFECNVSASLKKGVNVFVLT